jgi:preprotein translocase subunit SecG
MSLLINILTVVLILVSLFLVLVVLMQKAKSDGAVSAMGGSTMESTFGAESNNVLFNATRNGAIVFFVLSLALYLLHIRQAKHQTEADASLPKVVAPATLPAPAAAPATTPATGEQPPKK